MDDEQPRDESSGRFDQGYRQGVFLAALRVCGESTTGEVAEYVGCSIDTARTRLRALESDGEVESRTVSQLLVWTLNTSD